MKNQFTQNNVNYMIQFSNLIKIAYVKIMLCLKCELIDVKIINDKMLIYVQ